MVTEYSITYRDEQGRMLAVTRFGGMELEELIDFAINAARRRGAHLLIIRDEDTIVAAYGLTEGVWVSLGTGDLRC